MSAGFETVYENAQGMPVRLEAADRRRADGVPYRHHRLVVADGRPGAVVVAFQGDAVLVVRSNRTAAGAEVWEFPRGVGEPDETDVETGLRELREETGLVGHSAQVLGHYVIDTAIFPQEVAVVSCLVDPDAAAAATDGEIEEMMWVAVDDLAALVRAGTLSDAHTLAAISIHAVGEEV